MNNNTENKIVTNRNNLVLPLDERSPEGEPRSKRAQHSNNWDGPLTW